MKTSTPAHTKSVSSAFSVPKVQMLEVTEHTAGQRLDNFLLKIVKGVPKSHIYKAIRGGEVRVNKGRVKAEYKLCLSDIIRIPPFRVSESTKPFVPAGEFTVLYEDDAILIIDKPEGVAVHGGSGVSFGVIEQLRASRPEAPFLELVHRLDRDTSGVLVLAKKRSALTGLHESLRQGLWSKHYLALVYGEWNSKQSHVKHPLLKWTTATGERRVRVDPQGQYAHTIVTLKQAFERFTLVGAELLTGRTHQIRVHLAAEGFPIVGDDKYVVTPPYALPDSTFKRMFLHAHRLSFPHPLTHQKISVEAILPQACYSLLNSLSTRSS